VRLVRDVECTGEMKDSDALLIGKTVVIVQIERPNSRWDVVEGIARSSMRKSGLNPSAS
jgi:hypothetical protein